MLIVIPFADLGDGRRAGQDEEPGLGGGVGRDGREGTQLLGPAIADVDDPPPLSFPHPGQGGLETEKGALEDLPEHPVPIGAVELMPGLDQEGADGIDQDVEPAELVFDLPNQAGGLLFVRKVRGKDGASLPLFPDLGRGVLRFLPGIEDNGRPRPQPRPPT